jgi:hypothetical protein
MKTKNVIIFAVLGVLLAVAVLRFTPSDLSVTGAQDVVTEWKEITCQEDNDCTNWFLSHGVSQEEIDAQLVDVNLNCGEQNFCVARLK